MSTATLEDPHSGEQGTGRSHAPLKLIVAATLVARGLVALGFVVGSKLSTAPGTVPQHFLFMWDGTYYRELATHGYGGAPGDARFFPLFPLLGRWLGVVLAGHSDIALVVLANACALGATVLLWRLVRLQTGDDQLATRTALVFTLFPASAVLALPYAESLGLLMMVLAALALLQERPALAIAPLIAAGLTRPTGVILCVPVAIIVLQLWFRPRDARPTNRDRFTRQLARVAAAAAPLVGLLIFLVWLHSMGRSWTSPLDIQRQLRGGFVEPFGRFVQMVVDVFSGKFKDVYNLAFTVALIGGLVGAIRARYSWPWVGYLAVGLLVALAARNVDSIGRYGVLLAPAWAVGIAQLTRRRSLYVLWLATSSVGMVIITALWVRGSMIP